MIKTQHLRIGQKVIYRHSNGQPSIPMTVTGIFSWLKHLDEATVYLDFEGNEGDAWEVNASEVEPCEEDGYFKSLIELTDKYIGHPEEIDEGIEAHMRRKAYMDGLIDQQQMDIAVIERREKELIEKACKWVKKKFPVYGYETFFDDIDDVVADFKKELSEL